MQAIFFDTPGDASVLRLGSAPVPALDAQSVRIAVHATAVNRADTLQRRGGYKPPPGASSILGLECAGEVLECGPEVRGFQVGQRVMALLAGGGYAEQVVVHAGSLLPIPSGMTFEQAAAFPETMLTAFLNIFLLGALTDGGSVLVHGGSSGIGTSALALCREAKLTCYVTTGSPEKCARSKQLGAAAAINYRTESFSEAILAATQQKGVEVIIDSIGGAYLHDNLQCLAHGGRLVNIGLMSGTEATLDMRLMLTRNLRIIASTLRGRSLADKAQIVRSFSDRFGAALQAGRLVPIIDEVFPLANAAEAHRHMESSKHFGKIVLRVK